MVPKRSLLAAWALSLGFGLCVGLDAHAWSRHDLLTTAALESIPELAARKVRYTPLLKLVASWGFDSEEAFNRGLQIHTAYRFAPKAGERDGKTISVAKVLATYADEPDWGMDQELFKPDQYPELWEDAYVMMGGAETGTPTQAFRHMYWPEFSWKSPLATFKLPFGKLKHPMGKAPERVQVFVDLSRKAKASGDVYWAARFLANALHYLQDVGQPFHAAQTPSKTYLLMPFLETEGGGFEKFVTQVTRIVSYYHFAFEDYLAVVLEGSEGQTLRGALSQEPSGLDALVRERLTVVASREREAARQVRAMAEFSNALASQVARAGLEFFPKLRQPYAESRPHEFLHDPATWSEILKQGQSDSPSKTVYFSSTGKAFEAIGLATRSLVLGLLEL